MIKNNKANRTRLIIFSLLLLAVGFWLVLSALKDSIIYYYTPKEFAAANIKPNKTIRIGGFVKEGTLKTSKKGSVDFVLTYKGSDINILFEGVLPSLIREGQGVVIITSYKGDKSRLIASEVLAKHDENYLPADVYKEMKEAGKIDAYFGNN